jgi:hypothetical protein
MRRRDTIAGVELLLLILAVGFWWGVPSKTSWIVSGANVASSPNLKEEISYRPWKKGDRLGPYGGLSEEELWMRKPPMRRSEGYPPKTPEQRAMWQWWNAMNELDSSFEWKTPIEFYGKVIDQNSQPVEGAVVILTWSTIGGTYKKILQTRTNGEFSITEIQGKGISVDVSKEHYRAGSKIRGSFDYGRFQDRHFHVPDKNDPVVFELWKLGDSEPMYYWYLNTDTPIDGNPTWIDVKNGKIKAAEADIAFATLRSEQPGSRDSSYTLVIKTSDGGGIAMADEEFMFSAPNQGYQQEIKIEEKAGDPKFEGTKKLRFYLKTKDGKYAAVVAEITQFNDPAAGLRMFIYFNPSGSKNLEFDSKRQINK